MEFKILTQMKLSYESKQNFMELDNHETQLLAEINQALQLHKTKVSGSFLVLVHGQTFVDYNMLPKGIYGTCVPKLFTKDTTIDLLEKQGKMSKDLSGNYFLPESFFENLKKCQLVDMGLVELK